MIKQILLTLFTVLLMSAFSFSVWAEEIPVDAPADDEIAITIPAELIQAFQTPETETTDTETAQSPETEIQVESPALFSSGELDMQLQETATESETIVEDLPEVDEDWRIVLIIVLGICIGALFGVAFMLRWSVGV